jgi:hypothetical protein
MSGVPPASIHDVPRDAQIAYVEEMVSEAIRSGTVDPVVGLECFLYAADPEIAAALRRLAGLDAATRMRVLAFAQAAIPRMAGGEPTH